MGTIASRDRFNNSYFALVPTELMCLIFSYINDVRVILWFLSVESLQNTVYNCTREIRYVRYGEDLEDVNFSVNETLEFKRLQICEVPIMADTQTDLIKLSTHPTLREFSVTIPKEVIQGHIQGILYSVIGFFDGLIKQRGSILDMKIEIKQESNATRLNIASFFLPAEPNSSWIWALSTITFTELYEAHMSKSRLSTLYKNGIVEIEPAFSKLPTYQHLFGLLDSTNNINGVIINKNINEEPEQLNILFQLINLTTVYIYKTSRRSTIFGLSILLLNSMVDTLKFTTDIIIMSPSIERHVAYEAAANYSKAFERYMTIIQYVPRNGSIKFIYPLHSSTMPSLLQTIPNITHIGLYDDFIDIQQLDAFIYHELRQMHKIYIFTKKDRKFYQILKDNYGNKIIIKN